MLMALKNQYKRLLIAPETPPRGASWWYANIAAGSLAGATWLALTYPTRQGEILVRKDNLRSSKTGEAPRYEQRTFQGIAAKDGLGIFYRRFGLACSGAIVYYGLSFGMYDSLKPWRKRDSFIDRFFLGWGTSMIAAFAAHPLDRITSYAGKMDSKSAYHALTTMIKRKELKILTRGFSLGIIRALRTGGLLAGYDLMMPLMFPKQ
jgi:solute carrier family 25 (adenine nucleotide translocator) protein 4/5/6/31